jgi:predicted HicB family RNase H-like nuclease
MSRRPLKGNSNKTLSIRVSEKIHSALVDLSYKKNTTLRVLVTQAIEELIKKNQHSQELL